MSKRKIKIEDLRRFRFVSDPQISPDGEEIAFVLSTINYDKDRYERHIWLADRSTGKATQFTHGSGSDIYPRWSLDGSSLLFLSRGRDPEEKRSQLWVIPRTGGEARLVVEAEQGVSKPEWAPDSKRVLFLSRVWTEGKPDSDVKVIRRLRYKMNGVGTFEGRRTHLFTARLGRKPRQLTEGEFDVDAARWSPDSENIAYISNKEEDADTSFVSDIFLMPSRGGESRQLTEGKHSIDDLSWSPDGSSLAFIGKHRPEDLAVKRDLWVMPSEGGEKQNLTKEFDRSLLFRVGSDSRVSTPNPGAVWSHDSESIYFVTASIPHSNIYRVDLAGGPVEVVVKGKTVDGFSICKDGSSIAFNAMDATHLAELWVMPSEGGEKQNLTKEFDRSLLFRVGSDSRVSTPNPGAVWSHDGESIYFVTASIPHSNIYRVDLAGGPVEVVVKGKTVDGFSICKDGSAIAFNAMDATHLAELWVRDEGGERRLTGLNDRLLKGLDLSIPEHFTFVNGLGEEIDGWVIRPYGLVNGEKCPALLEIHGGPWSVYGDSMFHEFQVLTAEGYAVFYTNPRGSAGYDEEFAQGVMRRYGEYDYDDLMLFTDETLRRFGFIDKDKLGVLGGSYGGYMTNLIVCRTDRFSAAVTFRCVSNWVSKFSTSDIGYRQPEMVSGTKDYWDEMERHLERSPIKYAKNVKTPVLIIHSENDLRTPIEQAEQWFVSLKLNGVPTELVRFPDETHELSRSGKPKHREERLRHTLRWLNKYLKPS